MDVRIWYYKTLTGQDFLKDNMYTCDLERHYGDKFWNI